MAADKNQYFHFSGIRFHNVTLDEAVSKIEGILERKEKGYVITSNAQHLTFLHNNREIRSMFNRASLLVADGMSVVLASKILGTPLKERCGGPDLFLKLFDTFGPQGYRFFILGGIGGWEKKLEKNLRGTYPNLNLRTHSPPFGFEKNPEETESIIGKINRYQTDILILCVGSPKSEKWIADHLDQLNITLGFSLGAALGFFSGMEKRAPRWIQKSGFEWLYRLSQQPLRLWKRYLVGNMVFVFVLVKEFIKGKSR